MLHTFTDPSFQCRQRLAESLRREQMDWALIGAGPRFSYFTGRRPIITERLLVLLVSAEGEACLLAPLLQAPLYQEIEGVEVFTWADGEDAIARLAEILNRNHPQRIAINDEFYSGFLLPLQAQCAAHFLRGQDVIDAARSQKQPEEIAGLQRAASAIDRVWQRFCDSCGALAGQTEFALRERIRYLMQQEGFSEISWIDVGAGANGASSLHHGSEKVIAPDEPVVFDFAGCLDGYYGDICRVAITGNIPADYQTLYDIVLNAQEAAFQQIRPGVSAESIDLTARTIITQAGYGDYFTHRTGHGIGVAAHETPWIVQGNVQPLGQNMVFSIEPGIYLPDRWGVRIEDIVIVTVEGAQRLTQSPRFIVVIDATAEPVSYAN